MQLKKLKKIIICLTFVFLPLSLFAKGADNKTGENLLNLTLSDAIKSAIKKNPEVKAAEFKHQASESDKMKARSGFYPQINFTETFNRTNNPMWAFGTKLNQESIAQQDFDPAQLNNPDAINNFASSLSVTWPVYTGGRISGMYKQAELGNQVEKRMLGGTKQKIIAQTSSAYMGLLLAIKKLQVAAQSLESAQASLQLVKSRFDSGFSVKSDLLRAQVRIANLEQQKLVSESRIQIANAYLNAAMGIPIETNVKPVTPFGECRDNTDDLSKWIDKALNNRPELKSLHLQKAIAENRVSISRAEYMPNIQLVGNYEVNSENFGETANNYAIGAQMQMNLFSGFGTAAKTKAARFSLKHIQALIKSMESRVMVQTKEAFLNVRSASKRVKVARTSVEQAEEALRIVKNRYKSGLLTIVSLLDSEVSAQQEKTILYKAMHDNKVAVIQLELAAGVINTDIQ